MAKALLLSYTDFLTLDPVLDPHCGDLHGFAAIHPELTLHELSYNLPEQRTSGALHFDEAKSADAYILRSSMEMRLAIDDNGKLPAQAYMTLKLLDENPKVPLYIIAQDPRPELMMPWYTLFHPYSDRYQLVIPASDTMPIDQLLAYMGGQASILPDLKRNPTVPYTVFPACRIDDTRAKLLSIYIPDAKGYGDTEPYLPSLSEGRYRRQLRAICELVAETPYQLVLFTRYHLQYGFWSTDRFLQACKYSVALFPDLPEYQVVKRWLCQFDAGWADHFMPPEPIQLASFNSAECIARQERLLQC